MKQGAEVSNIDKQIADLFECKPLPEVEVKALCEKVIQPSLRLNKFCSQNPMFSLLERLSLSVEIYTASFMTLWNCSAWEVNFLIQTIFSWETMSIEVTVALCRASQCGSSNFAFSSESEISRQNYHSQRKSRITPNYSGLRVL